MKKQDYLYLAGYMTLFAVLGYLIASNRLIACNAEHPYLSGIVQFAVLATAGEMLTTRVTDGRWEFNGFVVYKMLLWGASGLLFTIVFSVFSNGVLCAMENKMLPLYQNPWATALFTSFFLNLIFSPIHTIMMRLLSNYGEARFVHGNRMGFYETINSVGWSELLDFLFRKTLPFFWFPVNTVGFMLPVVLRIPFAAMLSFVFGVLMMILRLRERKQIETIAS